MNYVFVPDTFNYNVAIDKFHNINKFVECQIRYKKNFEKYLLKYISMEEINEYIIKQNINIPRLIDEEYNFYHKYSSLKSDYLYVRNNYHVENLSLEEINYILSNEFISDDFFRITYKKVLFERGDTTFFGTPLNEKKVLSKSIVFEFAYNQLECTSVEQLNKIKLIINNCFEILNENLNLSFNIVPSFVVYNGIPNLFFVKSNGLMSSF